MKKLILVLMSVFLVTSFISVPSYAKKSHAKHRVIRKPAPPAIVVANIDISSQTMSVRVNGWPTGYWKVSTARAGYHTPRGTYGVTRTAKVYFSRKYDNSPMPNSVFFYGGYAIHGTGHVKNLGRPASHGCVRLHPSNAAAFYAMVQRHGARRTRITLTN